MDRRRFIQLSALTGTSATLASCGHPEYHLIRFAPEDELTAGIAEWKTSICPLCPAGCGLQVRVMEGDAEVIRNGKSGIIKMGLAKKLEGHPLHPVNRGKLCARGQAAAQITYHPDRIVQPLRRSGGRGEGQFEGISWDEALAELTGKLDALAAVHNRKALSFLTRRRPGLRSDLIRQFAKQFGGAVLAYEFFDDDVLRRANALSFGRHQLPAFDLGGTRYIISFGADFLGTWNSPVAQNIAYGEMRQGRPGIRGRFVQVECRMSLTGANADEWAPAKPGTEGVLALGLAHVIMKSGARRPGDAGAAGTLIEGWSEGLPRYTPGDVEKRTGISAARVERLAREFAEQQPSAAMIAGAPLAQTNGLFNALAVNALNALAGTVGFSPPAEEQASISETPIYKVADTGTQILLIDGANPVFSTPAGWKLRESLMQVPYIASFGSFIDETSVLADLILPDHSFLESWVEAQPESGTERPLTSVAPPVMRPLHDTRSTPDVLLDISRRLEKPLNLPWANFEAMLKESFGADWDVAVKQGWVERDRVMRNGLPQTTPAVRARDEEPQFNGNADEYPFHFLPYASHAFLDGSLAHLPLLQELPDPLSSAVWSSWVEINEHTAARMNIRQGDLMEIASTQGTLRAPAFPSPGIAPDAVAMPVGQGHETFTRYASGRGENPIRILAPVTEPTTGALAWASTRVRIAKVAGADGRLVLFGGSLREYPPERPHR